LTLRNDDPMTYRFRWHVEIDGHAMSGVEKVPPNKVVRLKLHMPAENFRWVGGGTLRSDTRAGVLTLEHEPHESLRNYPFPVKRYPIAASLSYWNEPWQGLWNSAWILLLLVLGISSSLPSISSFPCRRGESPSSSGCTTSRGGSPVSTT
jgi:hypothetical protein